MIRGRKGMLSTLDAVIFVTILAVVASCMIGMPEQEDTTPDAAVICEDLFDVRLQSSCVLPDSGDTVYGFADLTAMAISSGETDFLEDYIERAMDGCLSDMYGYSLTVKYGSVGQTFEKGPDRTVSAYRTTMDVMGDADLSVSLRICA